MRFLLLSLLAFWPLLLGLNFATARSAPRRARSSRSSKPGKSRGPAISVENRERLRRLDGETEEVFDEIMKDPENLRTVKEVLSFMTAFGNNQQWEKAIDLLEVKRTGVWPSGDVVITNTAMIVCGRLGLWEQVLQILETAPKVDGISYNLAMKNCGNAGKWELVLDLLKNGKRRDDFDMYNTTMHACAQGGRWEAGLGLLDEMLALQVNPSWTIYNLGIIFAAQGGLWESALGYLDDMWTRAVAPDALTYGSVIAVCEAASRWQEAIFLVQSLKRKGFQLQSETLKAAKRTCEKADKGSFAEEVLGAMKVG